MGKFVDLTNKIFGRWTVIKRSDYKGRSSKWDCVCKCGIKKSVFTESLIHKRSQSCGCLHKEIAGKGSIVNLPINSKYGYWTIMSRANSGSKGQSRWHCKCECGTERIVTGASLINKTSRSCGCFLRQKITLPKGEASFNAFCRKLYKDSIKRGYEFSLTKEQIRVITSKPCYYCGISPLQVISFHSHNGNYIYNGIDRVNNKLGYIWSNVVACCGKCNFAKHARDIDEFRSWIIKVYNNFIINKEEKSKQKIIVGLWR